MLWALFLCDEPFLRFKAPRLFSLWSQSFTCKEASEVFAICTSLKAVMLHYFISLVKLGPRSYL